MASMSFKRKEEIRKAIESLNCHGQAGGNEFAAHIAKLKESGHVVSEELYSELETMFRAALASSLLEGGSTTEGIIRLCVGYALTEASSAVNEELKVPLTGKLPFLLFEDVIEGSKLESTDTTVWSTRRAWELFESYTVILTETESLFVKGKLVMLRLCNGILRRLSKTLDTEWCGRVLMFLTAAFPLSERSALNVKGEANTLNATPFEDEDNARFGDNVEDEEPDDIRSHETETDSIETAQKNGAIDYELYKSLWGLQGWLSNPNLAISSGSEWSSFHKSVIAVIKAFEFYMFKEHELAQGAQSYKLRRQPKSSSFTSSLSPESNHSMEVDVTTKEQLLSNGAGKDGGGMVMSLNCKYLTTSHLLRLQLVDPQFRMHLITQLFFLLNHIKESADSNYTTILSNKSKKSSSSSLFLKTEDSNNTTIEEDRTILDPENLFQELDLIEKRLSKLLSATPPNGQAYLHMLQHVVKNETAWTEWKDKNKCKPFERKPISSLIVSSSETTKRKRESSLCGIPHITSDPSQAILDMKLSTESIGIRKKVPNLKDHIAWYIECDDPDMGIEKEYHAKFDKKYCWRATRLVMTQRPHLLDAKDNLLEKVASTIDAENKQISNKDDKLAVVGADYD